ncbi:MAG: ABC transporter ATP-binding protein, partial [Staphylococcus warneri]|nr:ABC transporter ATP-binding protein [Staphylococcus warneri]
MADDIATSEPAAEPAPPSSPVPRPDPQPPILRIENVVKTFGSFRAVDGVSLDIRAGEFFALLGPSGCGKTTLLRMLAGFETPDEGRILLSGEDIAPVLPHQRPVNMMFQNYALFPHLNVRDNIAFGLKRAGMPRGEIASRVAEMVALVRLEGLEKRKPDQLSGGQKQRVALARSLARRPKVLLLDEPMAALDKKLRESTQFELMELQRKLGMTFIIVTHDQEEALSMADRIVVLNKGRIEQIDTPDALYDAPASLFVNGFIGHANFLKGRTSPQPGTIALDAGCALALAGTAPPPAHRDVMVSIRPENLALVSDAQPRSIAVTIRVVMPLGAFSVIDCVTAS